MYEAGLQNQLRRKRNDVLMSLHFLVSHRHTYDIVNALLVSPSASYHLWQNQIALGAGSGEV